MRLNLPIRSTSTLLTLLATTLCLAGCLQTQTTRIVETDTNIRADICRRAWRPVTYSSRDTEQTQLEARANNAAREAFCRGTGD